MLKEFKAFAMKGNVLDLAIGIIIGAAFGKITTSFVGDIIMPAISIVTGKIDFTNLFITLDGKYYATLAEAQKAGGSTIAYGNFITNIINFLVIAFSIFIVIKQMERFKKKSKEPEITEKKCPFCKSDISIDAVKCPFCTSAIIADNESGDGSLTH